MKPSKRIVLQYIVILGVVLTACETTSIKPNDEFAEIRQKLAAKEWIRVKDINTALLPATGVTIFDTTIQKFITRYDSNWKGLLRWEYTTKQPTILDTALFDWWIARSTVPDEKRLEIQMIVYARYGVNGVNIIPERSSLLIVTLTKDSLVLAWPWKPDGLQYHYVRRSQ